MVLQILRAAFVLLMAGAGWALIRNPVLFGKDSWLYLAAAVCVAVLLVCVDILAPRKKLALFSGVFFGLIVGMSLAYALTFVTPLLVDQYLALREDNITILAEGPAQISHEQLRKAIIDHANLFLGAITCYLSISFILQTKDDFRFVIPYVEFRKQTRGARQILLDTSVLIDGRISDIADSGVLDSQLVVPRFVINELQLVADSADKLKRNRGRRGLDTVAELKTKPRIEMIDYDASGRHDIKLPVDELLLLVAKDLNARVLTNDLNLNKVAQLRGVDVINLNDLANAMKPVVLPGEKMTVRLIKAGDQPGQGVGYLDDGTMVVVEHGRQHLNEEVELTVTNTVQNTAGRMIFGRMSNGSPAPGAAQPAHRPTQAT